jgi:hypothetical protein
VSRGPPSSVRIVSTVQWYCQQWGTDELRAIRGPKEMQALRTLAEDGHNLPAGWTRLEYIDDSLERYGYGRSTFTTPRYYYKHESDPHTEFWYPIPLCEGLQAPTSRHPETLISCRTQRAWFYLADSVGDTYHTTYSLRNGKGAWVGVLQLHSQPAENLSNTKLFCELVEISRGYVLEGTPEVLDELRLPDRPKLPPGEKYEFVNVLWVAWEEGIAYRKAYGRVMKSSWEGQELQCIDLVLG